LATRRHPKKCSIIARLKNYGLTWSDSERAQKAAEYTLKGIFWLLSLSSHSRLASFIVLSIFLEAKMVLVCSTGAMEKNFDTIIDSRFKRHGQTGLPRG